MYLKISRTSISKCAESEEVRRNVPPPLNIQVKINKKPGS